MYIIAFFTYQEVRELELLFNDAASYREVARVSPWIQLPFFVCISSRIIYILNNCLVWCSAQAQRSLHCITCASEKIIYHPPVNSSSPDYGCIQRTSLPTLQSWLSLIWMITLWKTHQPKTNSMTRQQFLPTGSYLINQLWMFRFHLNLHIFCT